MVRVHSIQPEEKDKSVDLFFLFYPPQQNKSFAFGFAKSYQGVPVCLQQTRTTLNGLKHALVSLRVYKVGVGGSSPLNPIRFELSAIALFFILIAHLQRTK
ncbi:MAG: hypothetical protein IJX00_04725 [Clostridia bacterium]|nr:hypothetical protein [Clostridia bacterium]